MSDRFQSGEGHRGVLSTAAVAAPFAVGGAMGARELYHAAKKNGGKLFSFASRGKQIFDLAPLNPTSAQMADLANHPGATVTAIQSMAKSYYKKKGGPKVFDFDRALGSASSNLEKMLGKESKHALLSHAVYNAHLSSLSTRQAAEHDFLAGHKPMGVDELSTLFHGPQLKGHRIYNEKFIRTLNSNFSKALKTVDTGMPSEFVKTGKAVNIGRHRLYEGDADFPEASEGWQALMSNRPAVASEISGTLGHYSEATLISEDVVSGKVGRVLAISLTRTKGKQTGTLVIPIIGDGGEVRMGKNFAIRGAGRNIYDHNESLPADVFLARNSKGKWSKSRMREFKADKKRAFIFGSVDPLDEFSQGANKGGLTTDEIRLRSQQHVPTAQKMFQGYRPDKFGNNVLTDLHFDGAHDPGQILNAEERVAFEGRLVDHHGLGKFSSEGSMNKGVRDSASTEFLHFGGITDPNKQMAEYRAMSKGIGLVPGSKNIQPFLATTAAEEILGHSGSGAVGARIGGVSPLAATLFGDLPDTVEELEDAGVGKRFQQHLMHVKGIDERNAQRVWERTKKNLTHGKNLQAAHSLGRLGEGGFLTQNNFGGSMVETHSTYQISELHLSEFQKMHFQNESFSSSMLLGFKANGKSVTARGDKNYIDSISKDTNGVFTVGVREHYRAGSGTKFDAAGIKGLGIDTEPGVQDAARNVLNDFEEATWDGKSVLNRLGSDVNVLALTNFNHDKADPVAAVMGAATDTMRRLESAHPDSRLRESAAAFQSGLGTHHASYVAGQIIEDSKAIAAMTAIKRRDRITALTKLSEKLMVDVGEHIRAYGGSNDSMFENFRSGSLHLKSGELPENAFLNFSVRNGMAVNMHAWNTSQLNLPAQTKLTFDMQSQMYGNGYHTALQDLQSHLHYPAGDPAQARSMLDHITTGDMSKPLGTAVTLEEAFPDGTRNTMSTSSSRVGTILEPESAIAQNNFSLDLGAGAPQRYVPVLGHEAFGGKANRFGDEGKFSQTELEKGIRKIHNTTGADQEAAVKQYMNTLRGTMYGKHGYLRADAIHDTAASGFIQTAPSSLRHADGSVNPFEVSIGEDMAKRMGATDGAYAALTRHPVSTMPFVRIKIDKNLTGSNLMGLDVGVHSSLHADDDGDIGNLFLLTGSEAQAQAHNEIHNAESAQHRRLKISNAMLGVGDDTRRLADGPSKDSLSKRVADLLEKSKNRIQTYKQRTTGQSIGAFSNSLTRMSMQLEQNPNFMGREGEKSVLSDIFWQATRQTTIAAQKSATAGFDIAEAMKFSNRLNESLNKRDGEKLHKTLIDLTRKFEKPTTWIPEMADLGIADTADHMVIPMTTWLGQNKEAVSKRFVGGMSTDVDSVFKMITASDHAMKGGTIFPTFDEAHRAMGDTLPYLQSAGGHVPQISRVASIADKVAEDLGGINSATSRAEAGFKSVSEKVRQVAGDFKGDINMSRAAKWIGAGVAAAAAAAGLMTAKPSFDRRKSSNSLRPEEVAGTQDHIPSEPVSGSRSPSAPPRRTQEAPAVPRVSIITPVSSAVNLDVQLRGDNRQDSVEKLKLAARMSGSDSSRSGNFTVINRDDTRINSLRFKAKMREALDQ